ncbi:hypothetical protein N9W40_01815 [Flavobacteriales bacterium]|jgi:hypothetical protein|nr:hypothetical protein [Polaribacter sp.]MDA8894987.1 hypothetical protein [Flavobacteriales bacterium]MDA8945654.1 hypothetical protein [Flavobacteriales bacterium]MDB2442809.1 hypothetical protein [Flavobacteriales bacterium]MDG1146127.1 hypothetical protein [Flavobacteriales bacterium]|tara:strand:- start:116 stop:367 length:252 start_codon:yes stop_codon:yes gene_type:complete
MKIPKFLVGDNTDSQDTVFIVHTESPKFVLNLDTDDVMWMDDDLPELLGTADEAELTTAISELLALADEFYQREIDRYEELED